MLTALVSTISNSQVFLLKKNVSSFCKCKSYSHFFSANILAYTPYLMIKVFNDMLTNDIVSFEQLGPEIQLQYFALNFKEEPSEGMNTTNTLDIFSAIFTRKTNLVFAFLHTILIRDLLQKEIVCSQGSKF